MKKRELIIRRIWLTIQRSRNDARARRIILRVGLVLLYYAAYAMYLRREAQEVGPWSLAFSVVLLALASCVVYLMRRGHSRQDASLLTLSARAPVEATGDLLIHRQRIADQLIYLSAMVDRAGAEALHHQGKMSPELVGISRRRTLDALARPELWSILSPVEQELLRSPEGSWDWHSLGTWIVRSEDVCVLRWVLGIDQVLVPFEFLRIDLAQATELTLNPSRIDGQACLASYDLRPEQTLAQAMVTRCVSEGIRRGEVEESDPEVHDYFLDLADRQGANESEDLLTGPKTVGKSSWQRIQGLGQAALRRLHVLNTLISYLNGPADQPLLIPEIARFEVSADI